MTFSFKTSITISQTFIINYNSIQLQLLQPWLQDHNSRPLTVVCSIRISLQILYGILLVCLLNQYLVVSKIH